MRSVRISSFVTLNLFQGPFLPSLRSGQPARWMLKRVQHDGFGKVFMAEKATKDDWRNLADNEVKGRDLTWHVPEGFAIEPLYTAEDAPAEGPGLPGFAPFTRGVKASMYAGRPGLCGSTPASRPPRNRTPSIAATSPPGRRACRSPSTSRPTAATIPTTRAWSAMSARPAWRSTRSRTWRSCSPASRSTRCRSP